MLDINELIEKYKLTPKEHERVLDKITAYVFGGKKRIELPNKPVFVLMLSQTGGGKSNLTALELKENPNLSLIDPDKYKQFRKDNEEIVSLYPTEYNTITRYDGYLHRDESFEYGVRNRYDLAMETAPSKKGGIFVNIDDLIRRDYDIVVNALAVGYYNSLLSTRERYEAQIEVGIKTPKLTEISRHDDSFESLNSILPNLTNHKKIDRIRVYTRSKEEDGDPELVYPGIYSDPMQALRIEQDKDNLAMLKTFDTRYKEIITQMNKRKAPSEQYQQMEYIKASFEDFKKKRNEIDDIII